MKYPAFFRGRKMTGKEREELAEAIGKGLASGTKISAEDLQNENTVSYKMGEIMEMDADFVTLLNFVDWYSPTKEVNEKLTKMLRHIAVQFSEIEKEAKAIVKEGLQIMFVDGETYNPLQLEYYKKAENFLKG